MTTSPFFQGFCVLLIHIHVHGQRDGFVIVGEEAGLCDNAVLCHALENARMAIVIRRIDARNAFPYAKNIKYWDVRIRRSRRRDGRSVDATDDRHHPDTTPARRSQHLPQRVATCFRCCWSRCWTPQKECRSAPYRPMRLTCDRAPVFRSVHGTGLTYCFRNALGRWQRSLSIICQSDRGRQVLDPVRGAALGSSERRHL